MEIHAPEKPILTVKEAVAHLAIVTVGILIALSLEAIVEYVHHRSVVREAREIMREEIGQNSKELDETLAHVRVQGGFLATDAQQDFVRVQAAAFAPGLSAFSYGLHRDLAKAPSAELQAIADKLREALGALVLTGQTGKELHDQYVKVLAQE